MPKPRRPLKVEKSCPLQSAHTRLRQAHELWHRLVAAYPDPDEFTLTLNQALVTLRQFTFMVQKQKDHIENFEAWYESWQEALRADPIMTWLKDARNQVEKAGDLELASTARVEVVASWLPGPLAEFEVSPLAGPEEMASSFPGGELPDDVRKEGLLRIERRWVSKDPSSRELTEVIAYGYGVLATFLAEAHEKLGIQMRTFGGETHEGRHVRTDHLGGRLPCMVITDDDRVAHVHLGTGELLTLKSDPVAFDPNKDAAQFERRMEAMTIGPDSVTPGPGEDPLDWGSRWMSVARRTLAHDGFHLPHAFLFDRNLQAITVVGLLFEDQAEKYMAFRRLARDVDRLGADVVILINEMWMAPMPEGGLSPSMDRPSERADRSEALAVTVATSDGGMRTYYSPFTRDKNGHPVLGEVLTEDGGMDSMLSLRDLKQVWKRWRDETARSAGGDSPS